MKKLFVLLFVLVLALALVACGEPAETENEGDTPVVTDAPENDTPDTDEPGETEHQHDIEVEEKQATCTERGYRVETCKTCGEVVFEEAYPKPDCTPSGEATCEADSACTMCGRVFEAAKGHVIENVTEYVAATCTTEGSKTGVCSVCGETKTIVLPMAHVVETLGDFSTLTFVDGKVQAACSGCNQVVDVTAEVRLLVNFDAANLQAEIDALATAENGLTCGDIHDENQAHTAAAKLGGSMLKIEGNKSAGISFNAALLKDADYYVVSFDWCVNGLGSTSSVLTMGIVAFAETELLGAHTEKEYDFALKIDRNDGTLFNNDKSVASRQIAVGTMQHVDILVDNTTGHNYVYIDGVFYAANETGKWLVDGDGKYTLRLGGQFNVPHKPSYDNLEIKVLETSK